MTVYRNGTYVVIEAENLFVAKYEGANRVEVCVSRDFASRMTGMCGNFDGDTDNDLVTSSGTSVDNKWWGHNSMGDSWKIRDPTEPK